ncbi:RNA-guided endonuclease TnpB family protein [Kitasatospora sp. NRRL B-11411]|uniref:RNA-guided endonuclease InsQ/TnpB family protein n=1 Tax=Kitasatospora sp. NRRL B-11411 TaxID=1463822 RepID=UPI0004C3E99E|nr:RNA-guided endonuclease TnpB family protein [Kitasatospora sp. NRRL B-11411]
MQLRYSFRVYPTAGQRAALARAFGCARVVYNDALRAREDARAAGLPFPRVGDLSKALITGAKKTPQRAWLGEVSAVVLQQSLRDLEAAYRNFFDGLKGRRPRMGVPRFKSRKDTRQAVRFTANARWSITPGGKLSLPKIGDLAVKWSRTLPSTPSTVAVVKDSAGRYSASFTIETDPAADLARMPDTDRTIGIDLGLGHFAVLSDGTKIDSPRFLRRAENTRLIRDNQAIAVEDLAVKALARTRMAKSVHDAGWSAFVAMLEYKAARYGRRFVRIGRFEPTSQVCSHCGVKDGPKPLDVRAWTCGACGTVLDRDINAAVNVAKAAGLAVTACRAQVRRAPVPAPRSEAGTHPKRPTQPVREQAGIPSP